MFGVTADSAETLAQLNALMELPEVRAAIEAGKLDPQRFANYLKLSEEVAGAANKLASRRAQKAEEKVLGKAFNKRLDDKYGRH